MPDIFKCLLILFFEFLHTGKCKLGSEEEFVVNVQDESKIDYEYYTVAIMGEVKKDQHIQNIFVLLLKKLFLIHIHDTQHPDAPRHGYILKSAVKILSKIYLKKPNHR